MLILKLVLILSSFLVHLSTESSGFSNYNFFHKIISPISPKKTQNSQYPVKQKIINKTTFVTGKTFFISNNYKNSTVVRPRRFYSQLLSLPSSVYMGDIGLWSWSVNFSVWNTGEEVCSSEVVYAVATVSDNLVISAGGGHSYIFQGDFKGQEVSD
eukprot:XP_763558.1 hypothetical protein [Theileria parva strain Muguga]